MIAVACSKVQRHEFGAVAQRKFAECSSQVSLDSWKTRAEPLADQLVGKPGCRKARNVPFACRKHQERSAAFMNADRGNMLHVALKHRLNCPKQRYFVRTELATIPPSRQARACNHAASMIAEEQLGFVPLADGVHEAFVIGRAMETLRGVVPACNDDVVLAFDMQFRPHRIDAEEASVGRNPAGFLIVGDVTIRGQIPIDVIEDASIAGDDLRKKAREMQFRGVSIHFEYRRLQDAIDLSSTGRQGAHRAIFHASQQSAFQ